MWAFLLVDRAAFLKKTAQPVAIRNLKAEHVLIRIMDDFAIIHAHTRYTKTDGTPVAGRYTDVGANATVAGSGLSAQVTRLCHDG